MNIKDFAEPKQHPFCLLSSYKDAYEKEGMLAFILGECVKAGSFCAIATKYDHPDMVNDGLLEKAGDKSYKLTTKSIGLLYSVYGKPQ